MGKLSVVVLFGTYDPDRGEHRSETLRVSVSLFPTTPFLHHLRRLPRRPQHATRNDVLVNGELLLGRILDSGLESGLLDPSVRM